MTDLPVDDFWKTVGKLFKSGDDVENRFYDSEET